VIAGGSGYIGNQLACYFGGTNQVYLLTRNVQHQVNNAFGHFSLPAAVQANVHFVHWDAQHVTADWLQVLNGCDMVINLSGKSVNCRYTQHNKQEILNSRVQATEAIGAAIAQCITPPKLWINASSATIYRHATDKPQDEYTGEYHNDFSVQVCKQWEQSLFAQRTPFTRKIALRMAVTLGTGGVMIPYMTLCKFGLGGYHGNGRQMFSWVHMTDVCRAIAFVYKRTDLEGVFNVSSPNPVTNYAFMQTLRKATGHLFGLPAFTWMLKIGALLMGTETELLLKSRWVLPTKLMQEGFTFQYAQLQQAFEAIVTQTPRKIYHLF
jgi:uncharacterized protein (TIGR01777 family)